MLSSFSRDTANDKQSNGGKLKSEVEKVLQEIEDALPAKASSDSVCEKLRRKGSENWSENDRKLWNKNQCH
jgi:hypothetical protein